MECRYKRHVNAHSSTILLFLFYLTTLVLSLKSIKVGFLSFFLLSFRFWSAPKLNFKTLFTLLFVHKRTTMPSLLKVAAIVAGLVSVVSADCTWTVVASSTDTCATIAAAWGLNVDQFAVYNPITGWNCSDGVIAGETYCVEQNYGLSALPTSPSVTPPVPTPTSGDPGSSGSSGSGTVSAPASPTAPNGSPIPSPVQDGISPDCK